VTVRTEQFYQQVAEDALRAIGCTEPPVPISDIVASLNIPVRSVTLPAFFTAATIYEDGLPVMVINRARPEIEQRRALAHMTGHVLLALSDDPDPFPRAEGSHRQADLVARELMMPMQMLIQQSRTWFNDYRYLSRLFGVTEGTMLDRMRELGLVRNQNTAIWDF
jgi:Zn-dependent peptidase ImmA (M78 family)